MRSGVAPIVSSTRGSGVTTDLLSEWTDPDTAMEAVGVALGVFDDGKSPVRVLREDAAVRGDLDALLHRMADGGALETRGLADGRCAFRWTAEFGGVSRQAANDLVTVYAIPRQPTETIEPETVEPETVEPAPSFWMRMLLQTAPLLLPSVSCVLAVLAFLWLDQGLALAFTAALAIVGIVGIVRRVQLATFWMIGLVIAALLVRFS